MAKLRYTIRLYRLHDLDLITFAETHEFNVIRAMYSSLSAFAKGEAFVIEIPPRREQKPPQLNRVYIKALTLDDEKDRAAVAVINTIAPGYRNSFLKNLLRLYLCNPLSEEFFKETKRNRNTGDIIYVTPQSEIEEKNDIFTEKFQIFKEGKKMVQAGKLKKRTRHKPGASKKEQETEISMHESGKENKEVVNDTNDAKAAGNIPDISDIPIIPDIDGPSTIGQDYGNNDSGGFFLDEEQEYEEMQDDDSITNMFTGITSKGGDK